MIDLHCHSTASDGVCTPAQLVAEACRLGLSALALTDHDTVSGIPEFRLASHGTGVEAVPGVEISCRWYGGSLHLLGLYVDPQAIALRQLLEHLRGGRRQRNRQMLARLHELGMSVRIAAPEYDHPERADGRPHMAQALVRAGYCMTTREAFERWLGRGKPAYVSRELPMPFDAVRVIHEAGGVAIWAHPLGEKGRNPAKLRRGAQRLQGHGVDGIEVMYSEYTPRMQKHAQDAAAEFGLLPSGGSDFHGATMPGIALGVGRGGLLVPDAFLDPLRERAARYRAG
ncbi:MAG: hypothetical protein A3K19_33755 [Lentisphaerae bacterium RIFOXYB12_FULL_65_16]|nr:MAG: hypothetical protein A3K19_30360 [Lentisphaerae bacterium RIFOXYB12_FULL_65_16]OGV95399.1 MAG: hypothetical protein A3K19_33755 [Lentisphaerae bacterium RIFOXYB12_FULL_65_16]